MGPQSRLPSLPPFELRASSGSPGRPTIFSETQAATDLRRAFRPSGVTSEESASSQSTSPENKVCSNIANPSFSFAFIFTRPVGSLRDRNHATQRTCLSWQRSTGVSAPRRKNRKKYGERRGEVFGNTAARKLKPNQASGVEKVDIVSSGQKYSSYNTRK